MGEEVCDPNSDPETWIAGGGVELRLIPLTGVACSRIGEDSWDEDREESLGELLVFAKTVFGYLSRNVWNVVGDHFAGVFDP